MTVRTDTQVGIGATMVEDGFDIFRTTASRLANVP